MATDQISENDMEESVSWGSKNLDKKIKDFEKADPDFADVLKKYRKDKDSDGAD